MQSDKKEERFNRAAQEPQVQELVQVLGAIVEPRARDNLQPNLHHETQLHGFRSEKRVTRARLTKRCKTLSRRQAADMGMYTLPTRAMRYSELLQLHRLWLGYIRQHMGLRPTAAGNGDGGDEEPPGARAPLPHEPGYDAFAKLLVKADFHGAIVRVTRSKCPGHVGCEGIVAMDTKNTFKVIGKDNKLRTIPKQDSVFRIHVDDLQFTMFGRHLGIRPAERSVKKIKNFMDLDL